MKSNARIILAISFALFSTATIVTCATPRTNYNKGPGSEKLQKFETNFNNTMVKAIRANTFTAEKCFKDFVDNHIESLAMGAKVCNLDTAQKQDLREAVQRWIDTVSAKESDPLPGCIIDDTWFSMRVTNTIPTADGSVGDAGQ